MGTRVIFQTPKFQLMANFDHSYESDPILRREKRASLTSLVLANLDYECCRVMAEVFENPRTGWMNHFYWEESEGLDTKRPSLPGQDDGPACVVM